MIQYDPRFFVKHMIQYDLPSGKRLHNYGKSPFCSWANQLFLWPCSIAFCMFTKGFHHRLWGFPTYEGLLTIKNQFLTSGLRPQVLPNNPRKAWFSRGFMILYIGNIRTGVFFCREGIATYNRQLLIGGLEHEFYFP